MSEGPTPVLFEERSAANGMRIGIARLNAEKTLNALSLDMIDRLSERLLTWRSDARLAVVFLEAAGDKAFCAGADLHRLHRAMLEHRASANTRDFRANQYALAFFSHEYRLDYLIHTYPKPIVCWGHGIVMGGGVGLMMGASHRVVTERSRVAMPEINIGLYPDVGGSWLLGRMPGKLGLFLALTAAQLDASDALFTGIADHAIAQSDKARVLDALTSETWSGGFGQRDRERVTDLLGAFGARLTTVGPARQHFDLINSLCAHARLSDVVRAITACTAPDPWLSKAAQTLSRGSPSTAALSYELQRRARILALADVFRLELTASMNCVIRPDLVEGIRALLIDKDQRPAWQPATVAEITKEWIDGFFASPWSPLDHPLADLR